MGVLSIKFHSFLNMSTTAHVSNHIQTAQVMPSYMFAYCMDPGLLHVCAVRRGITKRAVVAIEGGSNSLLRRGQNRQYGRRVAVGDFRPVLITGDTRGAKCSMTG